MCETASNRNYHLNDKRPQIPAQDPISWLNFPGKIYGFYRDGFKNMTIGKTLWKIIIIKLLVMFAVLKLFFFPNYLKHNFSSDTQRAEHVLEQIISR